MLISGIVVLVVAAVLLYGSWMNTDWLMTNRNAQFMTALTGDRARTRIVYIAISGILLVIGFYVLFLALFP
jgi:hypothetical protein